MGNKKNMRKSEARTGIEPVHRGFADRCVTTSPPRHKNIVCLSTLQILLLLSQAFA